MLLLAGTRAKLDNGGAGTLAATPLLVEAHRPRNLFPLGVLGGTAGAEIAVGALKLHGRHGTRAPQRLQPWLIGLIGHVGEAEVPETRHSGPVDGGGPANGHGSLSDHVALVLRQPALGLRLVPRMARSHLGHRPGGGGGDCGNLGVRLYRGRGCVRRLGAVLLPFPVLVVGGVVFAQW